jgi:hypothetical protein
VKQIGAQAVAGAGMRDFQGLRALFGVQPQGELWTALAQVAVDG